VARPAVAVALPPSESETVCAELGEAGFHVVAVEEPAELERALDERSDIGLVVLDGEIDIDIAIAYTNVVVDSGRAIPALTVVSPRTITS